MSSLKSHVNGDCDVFSTFLIVRSIFREFKIFVNNQMIEISLTHFLDELVSHMSAVSFRALIEGVSEKVENFEIFEQYSC